MEQIEAVILVIEVVFGIVLSAQLSRVQRMLHDHINEVEVGLKQRIEGFLDVFRRSRDK